jgi:hypothetical protein
MQVRDAFGPIWALEYLRDAREVKNIIVSAIIEEK